MTQKKMTSTGRPHPELLTQYFLPLSHLISVLRPSSTIRLVLKDKCSSLLTEEAEKLHVPSTKTYLHRETHAVMQTTLRLTSVRTTSYGCLFCLSGIIHMPGIQFYDKYTSHQVELNIPSCKNK